MITIRTSCIFFIILHLYSELFEERLLTFDDFYHGIKEKGLGYHGFFREKNNGRTDAFSKEFSRRESNP